MTRKIPEDWNLTLICLVPKVDKPETIHQFQSISFYNTLYKIVTNILVQRLKPPLDDLIHPLQASFVLSRKASDNIILAQEVIHSMATSKSKKGLMAIKIDMKKAFDRMDQGSLSTCSASTIPPPPMDRLDNGLYHHLKPLGFGEQRETSSFPPFKRNKAGRPALIVHLHSLHGVPGTPYPTRG